MTIHVQTPYWENEPHVMYSPRNSREYRVAETIAWFLYGSKYRAEPY